MIKINKKKKGFTLVELLAVVVILAIIILIATNAVIPAINKSKKKALLNEARVYLNAGENAYAFDNTESVGRQCKNVSDLNGEYVKKHNDSYSGVVITEVNDGVSTQTIHLTDGKYYIMGSGNLQYSDVKEEKPRGFSPTCSDFSPLLFDDANENSLAHKLIMNEGGETFDDNLVIISSRIANLSQPQTDPNYSGLYKHFDDDGASYYYRGKVDNNWVLFGGFLWRIIRINGDGSIRLLYSGTIASHTGANTQVGTASYGNTVQKEFQVKDITGLTNDYVTLNTESAGLWDQSDMGYMTNPSKIITVYPDRTPSADPNNNLSTYPKYIRMKTNTNIYFFKDFDEQRDCQKTPTEGDDYRICVLKCRKLGNPGEEGVDCIQSIWPDLANAEENYSETAPGVYPESNPTYRIFTSDYKYTCFGVEYSATKENSDGTTSVYVACAVVNEIVGTVKDTPAAALVKFRGLFSESWDTARMNVRDNNVKSYVDSWYSTNIYNVSDGNGGYLEDYISDEIFCNDRGFKSLEFPFNKSKDVYYMTSYRIHVTDKAPSFKCSNKGRDAFTLMSTGAASSVRSSGNGNGKLTYPVGLITADEASMAGATVGANNKQFYLYNGQNYWTMSPYYYSAGYIAPFIYRVNSGGKISGTNTVGKLGIRPVINLSPSVLYDDGDGTETNPYTVKLSS